LIPRSDYADATPGMSVDITGETGAAERFRQLIGTMAAVVQPV